MKQSKVNNLLPVVVILLYSLVLAYYTYHNANWIIGDNNMYISSVAIGKPFPISENFRPSDGRFGPLGQQHNNLLLFLSPNGVSAKMLYARDAIQLMIFPLLLFLFLQKILYDNFKPSKMFPWIALCFTIMYVSRIYEKYFLDFTYGGGFSQFLLLIFIWTGYEFWRSEKLSYFIVNIIAVLYLTYMSEPNFGMFMVYGLTPLIFSYKLLSSSKKVYCYIISLANSLLFLLLYYFLVYRYTITVYHPTDVENMNRVVIFFAMLRSQKMAILGFIIAFVRFIMLCWKSENLHLFFDSILFAGCAAFIGNVVLKLPTGHYYLTSIFLMIPAIMYFMILYIRELPTFIISMLLALFYTYKVPNQIKKHHESRLHDFPVAQRLVKMKNAGYRLFVIEPNNIENLDKWDIIWAEYQYLILQNMMRLDMRDVDFQIDRITQCEDIKNLEDSTCVIWSTYYGAPKNDCNAKETFANINIYY